MLNISRNNLVAGLSSFKSTALSSSAGLPGNKTQLVKRFLPATILVLAAVVAIFAIGRYLITSFSNSANVSDQRINIAGAKKLAKINRDFAFPIKDNTGKEVTRMKYLVETAELRDEIIVNSQRMVTVKGRTFLIITIKMTNDYDKGIDFNARDFLRLSLNNSSDLLGADIHNDPVSVQAVSTKETRIGFPVSDTDKNFALHIGADKNFATRIPVNF